jgi:hypothetical protein
MDLYVQVLSIYDHRYIFLLPTLKDEKIGLRKKNRKFYHRQISSSSSAFFFRFPLVSFVGDDVGVLFSFFIFVVDGVLESFFFDGLTSDFLSFLTTTAVVEFDFLRAAAAAA